MNSLSGSLKGNLLKRGGDCRTAFAMTIHIVRLPHCVRNDNLMHSDNLFNILLITGLMNQAPTIFLTMVEPSSSILLKHLRFISQLVENHDGVRRQVVIPAEAGIQKNKKNIL